MEGSAFGRVKGTDSMSCRLVTVVRSGGNFGGKEKKRKGKEKEKKNKAWEGPASRAFELECGRGKAHRNARCSQETIQWLKS